MPAQMTPFGLPTERWALSAAGKNSSRSATHSSSTGQSTHCRMAANHCARVPASRSQAVGSAAHGADQVPCGVLFTAEVAGDSRGPPVLWLLVGVTASSPPVDDSTTKGDYQKTSKEDH